MMSIPWDGIEVNANGIAPEIFILNFTHSQKHIISMMNLLH